MSILSDPIILADDSSSVEIHELTLTNTLNFPFNSTRNVPVSVILDKPRLNENYFIEFEVLGSSGIVGEIYTTNKSLNGFSVSYTGSGAFVLLRAKIWGGMTDE